jgi:hypothetical protein
MESHKKTIAMVGMLLIVGVFLISFASAQFWVCFGKGEVTNYCGDYKSPESCSHDPFCQKCMQFYDPVENCYIHTFWNRCNENPLDCSYFVDGNVTYDLSPPEFNLTSPSEGQLFTDRNVLVEFYLSEEAHVYYTILNDDSPREVRICYGCDPSSGGFPSFSNERIFDDGLNEVMFRATDLVDNSVTFNVSFFVDSKEPIIKDTEPGFEDYASGEFQVEFNEENPTELKLLINYSGGVDPYYVNLGTECQEDRYGTLCTTDINMNKYNGQDVLYHFELTDIVGGMDTSEPELVKIDSTFPVIHSIEEIRDRRYLYFRLNYTEENLESIEYIDLLDPRARPKDLCRNPVDGTCYGRVSLRDGHHDIQFTVMDEAGNAVSEVRSIFLDTVVPRIYKTSPRRGFGDGTFTVQFRELNPDRLTLYYGNDSHNLDLINDCTLYRGKMDCETYVSLNAYDGMEIEYYFELEDIVGNVGSSRIYEIDVDTTFPVVNNPNDFYEINGRYAEFSIDITEENLDWVKYVDNNDPRGIQRSLCTRLYDGLCERKTSFARGNYSLSIQVMDEAGNAIALPAEFEVNY